jgi:hypothetical protein
MMDSSSSLGPAAASRHSDSKASPSTSSAFDSADCVHIADSSAADERLREERMTVVKALFVWVMLTASGWIYISPEWIPLFSVRIHTLPFWIYLFLFLMQLKRVFLVPSFLSVDLNFSVPSTARNRIRLLFGSDHAQDTLAWRSRCWRRAILHLVVFYQYGLFFSYLR